MFLKFHGKVFLIYQILNDFFSLKKEKAMSENNYVNYNDSKEISYLDVNTWIPSYYNRVPDGSSLRHLYDTKPCQTQISNVFPIQNFSDIPDNSIRENFVIADRSVLPDFSSRFGYNRCALGYCSGHWPGRYNESDLCGAYDPQPPNMAPERFYEDYHQGPFNNYSQANIDYIFGKYSI